MKNTFFEHHRYSDETFEQLMDNAIFVLDANVLLHTYRYNDQNLSKLYEVIDEIKDRLWCPYQIACEFHKNRTKLIIDKATFLNDLKDQLAKDLNKTKEQMNNPNGNNNSYTFLRYEDDLKKFVVQKINTLVSEVITHIDTLTNEVSLDYLTSEDPILERVETFFEGKVGFGFNESKLEEIYKDGKKRYNNEVPPGYEDKKTKPEPSCYGDLVIWEEIIEFASTNKKNVIYITDDVKKDWWFIVRGKKAGPRHELIREFKERTDHLFYAYTSEKFIELISSKYHIENTESLREESKEVVDSISFETSYKIAKIYITSTKVVVVNSTVGSVTTQSGYITYEILDQYGANITVSTLADNVIFQTGVGTANAKNGLLTITPADGLNLLTFSSGIVVTAYDTRTGVSTSATLVTQIGSLSDITLKSDAWIPVTIEIVERGGAIFLRVEEIDQQNSQVIWNLSYFPDDVIF